MEVYKNDHFTLTEESGNLLLTVLKPGFDLRSFNTIVLDYPIIQLRNFSALKKAIEDAAALPTQIGSVKPRIEVILTADEMEASIKLNITAKEFAQNKIGIPSEIINALNSFGITEGLENLFSKPLTVQKEFLIATGIKPEDGADAIVTYYELSDKKPVLKDDGSVNHYELKLIDTVKRDEWLGEKIPPTEGKPGKTVTGRLIPAKRGKDITLKYDISTVYEVKEGEKFVLKAAVDGAVKFEAGKIKIDNHLVIPGDVCYETGNINFDGFVTINGTIKDGFSVIAKYDISVLGPMGIGAVEKIISTNGNIYIKGGVFGRSTALIEAKKSVFVKYCNQCTITAGDDINVGFYALDSKLAAKKIILDPVHGKVIGGCLTAQVQIISGVIGNKSEKKTIINVQGFDRAAIRAEFEGLLHKYKDLLEEANKIKRQIEILENSMSGAEYSDMNEYHGLIRKYEGIIDEIRILDEYRQRLQKILETKGEGEVGIFKAAYPETYLEIKNMTKKISSVVSGSFYVQDKELHHN